MIDHIGVSVSDPAPEVPPELLRRVRPRPRWPQHRGVLSHAAV